MGASIFIMMHSLRLLAATFLLLLLGSSISPAADSQLVTNLKAGKPQTLVTYGTSLTAGGAWVGQLQSALKAQWPSLITVVNSGQGAMWSKWGVDNLDARVIAKKPDTVLIEFAINDAYLEYKTSVEQAKENLNNMIDRILKAKAETEIILMTMNPPIEVHLERRPNYKAYYEMYRTVAKEKKLRLIDHNALWEPIAANDLALFRKYVPDGIHPGPLGCENVITPELLKSLGVAAPSAPEKISLWPTDQAPEGEGKFEKANPVLSVYRPAKPNGASVVICPGGGYGGLVMGGEGSGIAKWLNSHGITGLVLEYRLPKGRAFVPLLDAQRAIRMARSNAAAWAIDPKRIGIIGFSAGGHLASTVATHFDNGNAAATDPIERMSSRPDFAILVYPVISMGEIGHGGSKNNLLGPNATADLVKQFSNELQITEQTCPTYLTHALDDKIVSPENSRLFHEGLKSKNVPTEYLPLASGGHGLNGYKGPMWDAWQSGSLKWLAGLKMIPAQE